MKNIAIHCAHDALVPVSKIKLNPKNRNKHPEEQILRLMEIIKYNGVRRCVTVSKRSGIVTVGHGRIEAMKRLGMKEIPVNFQDYESEDAEYADGVADNAIGLWAELDLAGINSDLGELGPDFDLDMLGIKDFVLDIAEKLEPGCDEDEVPEAGPAYVVKGDVFTLGGHRMLCGDSTLIDDVERLMSGAKADLTFTSPPYNANTRTGDGDIFSKKKSKKLYGDEGFSDNLESDQYVEFVKTVLESAFMVTEGFIFWNVSYNANSRFEYLKQIEDRLENLIEQICWKKSSTIPFKGSLMRDWEPIYVFSTHGQKLGLDEVVSNHWQISNTNSQQENHKACFPVELPEKGINLIKKNTGVVFEPFGGSGSTLIACEKTNRQCFMMELDEKYCTVILDRWAKYAGGDPIRESDGKLWSKIKAEAMNGAA